MNRIKKNALILTMMSFFLASCDTSTYTHLCNHEYEKIGHLATCEEGGYTENKCKKCGDTFITNQTEPLGHNYFFVSAAQESFEEDGNVDHYECHRCHKYFDTDKNEVDKDKVVKRLQIYELAESKDPVFAIHGPIDFDYDNDYINDLYSRSDQAISFLLAKNSSFTYSKAERLLNELNDAFYSVSNAYSNASLTANMYNRPSDYDTLNQIGTAYYWLYAYFYYVYAAIAKSHLAYSFFGITDSETAQSYYNYYQSLADSFLYGGGQEVDQIINDYKSGKLDRYTALSQYIKAANKEGKSNGYSNYIEYAYPRIYGREYSVSDTDNLYEYISDYIIPLYQNVESKVLLWTIKSDYAAAVKYNTDFNNLFYGNYLSELTEYADYLGGKYKTDYVNYFEKGYYYYSNIDNDNITAYVASQNDGTPYMYMSKNYQQVTTFIHEFGHYNAAFEYTGSSSYDLAETQSQGNEMLFYSYIAQNKIEDDKTRKYFLNAQIDGILGTVVVGVAINELERYAFTHEDFTKDEIEAKWCEIADKFGIGGDLNYMYDVLLNYHCYYISYAVSAVASLQIMATSLNDLDAAKSMYKSICKYDRYGPTFTTAIQRAGMYDVFSKEAYELIGSMSDSKLL